MTDNSTEKKEYLSQTAIKSMGFTDKMIAALLPEPELAPNPFSKNRPPMKRWLREDVELAMLSKEYQSARARLDAKNATSKKNAKAEAKRELFLLMRHTCPQCRRHSENNLAPTGMFHCVKCGFSANAVEVIHINSARLYAASAGIQEDADELDSYSVRLWEAAGKPRR